MVVVVVKGLSFTLISFKEGSWDRADLHRDKLVMFVNVGTKNTLFPEYTCMYKEYCMRVP